MPQINLLTVGNSVWKAAPKAVHRPHINKHIICICVQNAMLVIDVKRVEVYSVVGSIIETSVIDFCMIHIIHNSTVVDEQVSRSYVKQLPTNIKVT